jgi:hypothetical protein
LYKLIVVDWIQNTPSSAENNIESRWRNMLEGVFVDRRFVFHPYGTPIHATTSHILAASGRADKLGVITVLVEARPALPSCIGFASC